MMAFTLVGLMLSLFGGIFASLSALRNYTEGDIKDRCNRRELHLKDLDQRSKNGYHAGGVANTMETAKKHADRIMRFRVLWVRAQLFPTAMFLVFAIYMAVWALLNWSCLTQPQDWYGWKCILGSGVAVDLIALILMWLAWSKLRVHSDNLDDHMKTVQALTADIKPDGPK